MAYTTTHVRTRSAGVLAAVLTVGLLGCGAQAPPHSDEASRSETSVLTVPSRTLLSMPNGRQRAAASCLFCDPERTRGAHVPQSRSGLALGSMNAAQRGAAVRVVGTGLSECGSRLAHGVIELAGI